MKKSVLIYIVEDSVPSAMLYQSYLDTLGYQVRVFHTGLDALEGLNETIPDVLIQDVQLPDISGLDILKEVTAAELPTKTIVITSETQLDYAIEATQHGAFDFIEKPFSKDRLLITVANALRESRLLDKVKAYSDAIDSDGYGDFIGSSSPMKLVYQIIKNVAPSNANVFVTGESGTGKELCAAAIHQASERSGGPFIPINCAAIPKDLFESEIFGHIKGAFSGAVKDRAGAAEAADGGTLFLDEMCEMDLNLQAKLLRLIQSGTFQKVGSEEQQTVDIRFVCATNRDPMVEVGAGRFREDLYYRLSVVPIELPPLRERGQDVLTIAEKLLVKFNEETGKEFTGFTEEAKKLVLKHSWPGNVRELQNVIEHLVIMHSGTQVSPEMLPEAVLNGAEKPVIQAKNRRATDTNSPAIEERRKERRVDRREGGRQESGGTRQDDLSVAAGTVPQSPVSDVATLGVTGDIKSSDVNVGESANAFSQTGDRPPVSIEQIQPLWLTEKQIIQQAIRLCQDNVPVAAAHLGVSPSTLYRKMKSWNQKGQ